MDLKDYYALHTGAIINAQNKDDYTIRKELEAGMPLPTDAEVVHAANQKAITAVIEPGVVGRSLERLAVEYTGVDVRKIVGGEDDDD